LRPRD